MGVKTIDANMLKNMFLAGAKRIESKKEWINELNVFPVPDGDTGTNMTMTIMSAAREVSALTDPDMESLSKAISQGALRGARGNSGVILSQLFRGFTRPIKDEKVIDSVIAAEAFKKAIEAQKLGATYISAGHIFATDCKKDLPSRGLEFLKEVCNSVTIPVYAIGGIKLSDVQMDEIIKCGAKGGCIMSGMMSL